ncbi:MAG: hypothetical protein KF809_08480 [Chloroflexi bacterium]|nr:hypothetical protein [Chloroflexota bacterium]
MVIATVTWLALPDAYNPWFALTVDAVLVGARMPGDTIGYQRLASGAPEPRCPGESALLFQIGDRIAIAFDARYPGQRGRITTAAFVRPSGADPFGNGLERLTEGRIRRIVGARAAGPGSTKPGAEEPGESVEPGNDPSPAPDPSPAARGLAGIDCQLEYRDVPRRGFLPTALPRTCDQARAPAVLAGVLEYAQAQPTYAGAVFYHDAIATGDVWFTADVDRHSAVIAALAPEGTVVRVGLAERSWRTLHGLQLRITRDLPTLLRGPTPVAVVRIDVRANTVVVGLLRVTEDATAELRRRYGDTIAIERSPRHATIMERLVGPGPSLPASVVAPSWMVRGARGSAAGGGGDDEGAWARVSRDGRRLTTGWTGSTCATRAQVTVTGRTIRTTEVGGDVCTDDVIGRAIRISLRPTPDARAAFTVAR